MHAFHRYSALLVLAVASIAGMDARAVELTPTSPFAPQNNNADTNATPANSPLELHGILATPDGYKFNLSDPSGHINVWIGLNAADQPFVVRSHDVAHSRVTVEYQGRTLTLSLAQPKIMPMSIQQQAMAVPSPVMGGMPPMQPGAINNSPADQRQRLELIAEQIRRRRALRASMQQQQFPQGITPAPTFPQPPPQQN